MLSLPSLQIKDDLFGGPVEDVGVENETPVVIPLHGAEHDAPFAENEATTPVHNDDHERKIEQVDQSSSLTKEAVALPATETKNSNAKSIGSSAGIHALPIDALHCIASFMTPAEFCFGFGYVHRSACREIVRRVRMHAFKCATEVISTWKAGEREDARELAALYISNGVPIYTKCLGHTYHTLYWRMSVEARETDKVDDENDNNNHSKKDPFFGRGRHDFRSLSGYTRELTYLEEKCLFVASRKQDKMDETAMGPKTAVPIHQHLWDQHRLGELAVNDKEGRMLTPPVSLAAEFFHPVAKLSRSDSSSWIDEEDLKALELSSTVASSNTNIVAANSRTAAEPNFPPFHVVDEELEDILPLSPTQEVVASTMNSVDIQVYTSQIMRKFDDSQERHMKSRFSTYQRRLENFLVKGDSVGFDECMLDLWDEFFPHTAGIHYYDLETAVPRISSLHKFLTKPCLKAIGVVQCEIERIKTSSTGKGVNMKGRLFPTYEYRLFIRNRPPSDVGEPSESLDDNEPANFVRRDTMLMVAKNRGKRHSEAATGVIPISATSKKGSNNYYLYMPQQTDVDDHFNKVNPKLDNPTRFAPNGADQNPVIALPENISGSCQMLARVQSNFIGTEFQIFTPRLRKMPRRKPDISMLSSNLGCSEDELDYDSGVSSSDNFNNNSTSIRRSCFRRLSLRRGAPTNSDMSVRSEPSLNSGHFVTRTYSFSDMSTGRRSIRGNRRAIANDTQQPQNIESNFCWIEEDDGGIIYTANLLGSRPRIMDVCIPKVIGGVAGEEWRRYLDGCDDMDESRILSCFKQLNQRHLDDLGMDENTENEHHLSENTDFGLMTLQNRPPWWNVELGSFVLNFGGRVSVASVKNFQLCERTDHDTILLQFGRIKGRHAFTMDFQYPLTAVQAFSIAISSLQSKMSLG
jgi:hypothetical protein